MQKAAEAQAEIVAQLEALKAELAQAKADHDSAQATATAATEAHSAALQKAEEDHSAALRTAEAEVQRITSELEVWFVDPID